MSPPSSQLESCFTCLRRTDNFLCITERDEASGEAVEAIFAKHFWFTKCDYQDRTVCTSCWEKIDEFHKFYCEVERVHATEVLAEIKTEEEEDDEENALMVVESSGDQGEPVCKVELKQEVAGNPTEQVEGRSEDGGDNAQASSPEENSDESDWDVPLARRVAKVKQRRKRALKKRVQRARSRKEKADNDELNVLIRQHMDITCHKCTEAGTDNGETFDSFYQLRLHFKNQHDNSYGYIVCCNRKWVSKPGLAEHLQNHEPSKTDHSRCVECNCIFKDKSSYANHMFLMHTPEEQKQFKCDRCAKAFAAEDLLNSHLKWHDEVEKKNHYCEKCNKYFLSARNLENHIFSHHNVGESSTSIQQPAEAFVEQSTEEPAPTGTVKGKRTAEDVAKEDDLIRQFISLNCSKCDFVGETFNKLSYHALKAHNMNTHAVICCDRRFGKRQRLYEHCLRHLNPDHFKCELCGKTYADSSGLQIHKWWIHTPVSERPFKCDICGAAFVKDYLLKQHTNWHVNKERKKYYCELCNKAYSNSLQLRAHHQKKHGAVCDWVCDVCAKGFIHRALLEEHRLTHTEEGLASLKIQCEKCQRWLINKKSYLRHRRRCYDTSGPIKCDICGKESANEAALAGHKNFHHSNRPMFRCTFCGKECKTQLRLKEHEATHTGVVLYQCPYCPRTSNSSSNMYTHKKTAHPEKWQEEADARSYTR
ncbi:LOW QUALITY PROTEIN: transcription factor grauzone [Culex quinquefasciatus]|uniref:LOW QUALITY PROTEIN: transcription factor grauzone n=1 Tax=Culex quinquefasciatus TaxID=7176 RepID=UPI0018E3282E|nr:LOW QUALITY PROTEIN: transcription factor grauzone [Culex quinquefasciatus]